MNSGRPVDAGMLRILLRTPVFREYCRRRGVVARTRARGTPPEANLRSWHADLAKAAPGRRSLVEHELARVAELSGAEAVAHLIDAAGVTGAPPAAVPAGPPVALWFLVHRPAVFEAVRRHHVDSTSAWRAARPALSDGGPDPASRADALARGLDHLLRPGGPGCRVDVQHLGEGYQFCARVPGRTRLVEEIAADGTPGLRSVRAAETITFVFDRHARLILVRAPGRGAAHERLLLQCFAAAVLNVPLVPGPVFRLDPLRFAVALLPDADDVSFVRVKGLDLWYPARLGGRRVRLGTAVNDGPGGLPDLLRAHGGDGGAELRVGCAEIHVRFRAAGRPRDVLVRLWPDRCRLPDGLLGERLRRCLGRWGLLHG